MSPRMEKVPDFQTTVSPVSFPPIGCHTIEVADGQRHAHDAIGAVIGDIRREDGPSAVSISIYPRRTDEPALTLQLTPGNARVLAESLLEASAEVEERTRS